MTQPHLLCTDKDITENAIIVGDPARVDRVALQMDNHALVAYNREFKLIKGAYNGTELNVVSTGIGAPSAAIAIEELLTCGVKRIIRVGSAGAVQPYVGLGDLVIATSAVRDDGTSKSYIDTNYPASADISLTQRIVNIAQEMEYKHFCGIVRSHDSFYTCHEKDLTDYWSKANVLAADMETGVLFTLAGLKGFSAGSILNNVVLYDGELKQSISSYAQNSVGAAEGEKRAIKLALKAIASSD